MIRQFIVRFEIFKKRIGRNLERGFSLAKVDFKLRNEGTFLGVFWYLLNPVLLFLLLWLIFGDRLGGTIEAYPIYLFSGLIIFNFFSQATAESVRMIKGKSNLIKSINFPLEIAVIALVFRILLSHIVELFALAIFAYYFGLNLVGFLYYIPILVLFIIFVLGCCFFLSALGVFFIDLNNIWNLFSRLVWFATPIFYAIEGQTRLRFLNNFNPMFYFISSARQVIIDNTFPGNWFSYGMIGWSVAFLCIGLITFNFLKDRFVERI